MRVVVVGAGGLGSYMGAMLSRCGHEVTLVARGAHADAILRDGLFVETVEGDFRVNPTCVASALDLAGADLTIVAVKAFSLVDVAEQIAHLARGDSVVLSVLNGVTASERLSELGVSAGQLVDGIAYMTAFRTEPGRVSRKADHHRLVIGSTTGASAHALGRVREAFAPTTIGIEVAGDIEAALWGKMAVVCSLAVVCALTGRPMGPIRSHRYGAELQRRAIAEVTAVAHARGVAMADEADAAIGATLDAFPADFHPSVIHDLQAGRPTEMAQLGGVIADLGRRLGVATPLHEAATCAVELQSE